MKPGMKYIVSMLLLASLSLSYPAFSKTTDEYAFKVFLDDKEIGQHTFEVRKQGEEIMVKSEAAFNVKFLFFNAYTYKHSNTELWQEGCLRLIDAQTDDNGDELFVRGKLDDASLSLETPAGVNEIDGCIRSFAYWDLDLLRDKQLLNPQTGELLPVTVEFVGESDIEYRGTTVPALQYIIRGEDLAIELWYSKERDWLALESTLENGSKLSYRIP